MTTQDITRHLLQPGKHYSAARMQQGRSILDSDWNEDAMLEAEDLRATLADLTGGHGSPNAGFSISDVHGHNADLTMDFSIERGSMYVGGLRVELEESEQFFEQADWLRLTEGDTNWPTGPRPAFLGLFPDNTRYDLVYLHVWEQTVSMVEDRELREQALGGPDTTTRVRRMRRVEVLTGVGSDKADEAFADLVTELEGGGATFDHANAELVSNARLQIQPITEDSGSPCGSIFTGGYLGNDHQAIRVELRGPNTFTWGFCNTAPLHRVLDVSPPNANKAVLEFVTTPRDGVARPRVGQKVELLPWSARLANDEHVADLTGPIFKITHVDDREIRLDGPVPGHMAAWMGLHGGDEPHFYLRIWDRGPDTTSDAEMDFTENVPVPLGHTGLQATFLSSGRIGDYWVIAARKGTNARLLPWELLDEAAPHGTRHFYAPLAMIRWEIGEATQVWDIRRRLMPLCERGCCTITVGDNQTSHGQVNSLTEALELLPTTGGRICLLPGRHGPVEIIGRSNIEIVGCGRDSGVSNAPVTPGIEDDIFETFGNPLLLLTDCTDIVLRNFEVDAHASVGIEIRNSTGQSERIRLERMSFSAGGTVTVDPDTYALSQPAVRALGCNDLTIVDCRVNVQDQLNYAPAIVVGGAGIRIHRNLVQVGDLEPSQPAAMGGIQVLSQSSDVELIGNVIRNGWGNGITLGHLMSVAVAGGTNTLLPAIWTAGERNLGEMLTQSLAWSPVVGAPMGVLPIIDTWTPLGAICGVRIFDNHISGMSLSAISQLYVSLFIEVPAPGLVVSVVIDAEIKDNQFVGNALIEGLSADVFNEYLFAIGGVTLTGCINTCIHNNVIRDHGSGFETPVCGISVLAGQNLSITDNRIVDNNTAIPVTDLEELLETRGIRGGIFIAEVSSVRGYTFYDCANTYSVPAPSYEFARSEMALLVHGNQISHRAGKALWITRGFGPIVVTANSLHSFGDPFDEHQAIENSKLKFAGEIPTSLTRSARGACVEIVCYGTSPEVDYGAGVLPKPVAVAPGATENLDGRVLFSGNHTKLAWSWPGGFAASVLISSLDSVVVDHNTMTVFMDNDEYSDSETFVEDALDPGGTTMSFVMVNCWAGASSTVQATGNRFEEGLGDAFFSFLATDAITPFGADISTVKNALLATMNVATHCVIGKSMFTTPPPTTNLHARAFAHNVVTLDHMSIDCDYMTAFAPGTPSGPDPQVITVTFPT